MAMALYGRSGDVVSALLSEPCEKTNRRVFLFLFFVLSAKSDDTVYVWMQHTSDALTNGRVFRVFSERLVSRPDLML